MRVRTKRLAAVYSVCLGGLLAVVIVPTALRALDGDSGASDRPQIASPAPVDPAVERETVAPSRVSGSAKASASASATTISTGYSSTGIVRPIRPVKTTGPASTVPATVRDLHVLRSNRSDLVVGWSAASRATSYRVYLNGFSAAKVTGTSASLRWYEDGAADHYVEVLAVNSTGQVSTSVAFLQVVRPAAPTKADPTKADPTTADPTKADPTKADPTKADPTKKPSSPTTTGKPTSTPTKTTTPTKAPTKTPTTRPPTSTPTEPTQTATSTPSQPPTEVPSETATQVPSETATEEPTQTPSASDEPGDGDGKGKGKNGLIGDLTGLLGIG